jgi:hypothetical protein
MRAALMRFNAMGSNSLARFSSSALPIQRLDCKTSAGQSQSNGNSSSMQTTP